MMRHSRLGFTLIELLVVIAIIAILAAILFPVFARARERSRESACIFHMKEIAYALEMYLDDWQGCYPDHASVRYPPAFVATGYAEYKSGYSNDMGGNWIKWFSHRYLYKTSSGNYEPAGYARVLRPYLKNLGVFKCPSETRNRPGWLPYDEGSSYYVKHAFCYYANQAARPVKTSIIRYPKKTTLLYEEGWHGFQRPYLWDPDYWNSQPAKPPMKVNAVFTDCHVGKVDIMFHPVSGHDGNWYFYDNSSQTSANWGHFWDIKNGGRDIF